MRWRTVIVFLTLAIALVPAAVFAQGTSTPGDILIRYNGPLEVPAGQEISTAVVLNHDAVIGGTVQDALFVYNGTARISGTVNGDVVVVNGAVELLDGARVRNVSVANSSLSQASGATVTGTISRSAGMERWQALSFFSALAWFGVSLAVLLAGLAFAAFGGRQLAASSDLFAAQPAETAFAAVLMGIGLPIVAVLAIVTVVGIPFGIGLLLFLLPVLAFLGYLVAGTAMGAALLRASGGQSSPIHPYLAAIIGIVILQLVGLVPVLGGLVAILASLAGAGALTVLAWRGWRGPRRPPQEAPAAAGTPTPA